MNYLTLDSVVVGLYYNILYMQLCDLIFLIIQFIKKKITVLTFAKININIINYKCLVSKTYISLH